MRTKAMVMVWAFGVALAAPSAADTARAIEQAVKAASQARAAGNLAAAETQLTRALKAAPNHYRATYDLGLVYGQSGRTAEAINALQHAATLRSRSEDQDYEIYNTLGWYLMKAGKDDAAERQFLSGLQHKDKLGDAALGRLNNNLGVLYLSQGRLEAATAYFAEAVKHGFEPAVTSLQVARVVQQRVPREIAVTSPERRELSDRFAAGLEAAASPDR